MSEPHRRFTPRRLAAAGFAAALLFGVGACADDDVTPPTDPADRPVNQDDLLPPANVPTGGEGMNQGY